MAHFTSWDGTKLGYRRAGAGRPLVCLPGGPAGPPTTWVTWAVWPVPGS